MALNKRKVLEAARKHAQKGAKAKALKEYNKLLKEDPRDAKLLLEVGDAYRRWGQNEEAIAQYVKVANQYRQEGFDARAVAVFKQILNLDPKNYGAYVSLSELYQRMGLDSEAAAALQTAADGYHKEGRKTEALELLRQMAALDPTNTTSRLKVAELLRQEGMEDEAVDEYRAVIEELESQQDRDQLVTVIERLLEVKPDDIEAITRLVRCLMEAGEFARAEPLAVRALNVSEDIPQYELLLELYAQMGEEAKLADATRGLAKVYRDRGDEERARELMQRLPVEEVGSSPSLAVDVSEVDEPELGDDELLADDDDFLSLDDEAGPAEANGGDLELELSDEAPVLDLGADDALDTGAAETPAPAPAAEAPAEEELPLPEGEPDQLLAEASVYLRYGKRDQAIASLRGILAQEPNHRGALEKLGEAHADAGDPVQAVEAWQRAAEQMRAEGDAEALSVLRDRVAQLDPAAAAQIGDLASGGAEGAPVESDAMPELDLDMEVDLDLDDALPNDATAADDAGPAAAEAGDDAEFELELDIDGGELGLDEDDAADGAGASPQVELTRPDTADDGFPDEIDVETDDLGLDPSAVTDGDVSIDFDLDAGDEDGAPSEADAGGQSTATRARIDEELEEAEFYLAQSMYDEAERLLQGILDVVPNHPSALLRMGEVASAKGGQPDDAVSQPQVEVKTGPAVDFEITARFDDETVDELDVDLGDGDDAADDVAFEIDVDVDEEGDADALAAADGDFEVEVDMGLDDDEPDDQPEDATETAADTASLTEELPVEEAPVAEEGPIATGEDQTAPVDAATAPDPNGDSFDLREALADVFDDDEAEAAPDPNGESQVLSTVEDGFESIFSDFKKGVTATLDQGDFDTRYDLGIAYREMGLYEDAIGEFRVCLDAPDRRFDSLYLMGLCARDLGRFEDAVSHLEQALALPDLPEDRMAGVYFDLSIAEEGAGEAERACASVRRVLELDAEFPGAADRLAALESGESATPQLGEPGEAFESFDDLFSDDDDEAGDDGVAETASTEAFESFDDVVSEAEAALGEAEFVEDDAAQAEVAEAVVEADADEAEEDDDTQTVLRKGGRKKISFV